MAVPPTASGVAIGNSLDVAAIRDLLFGQILAIKVPDFYPKAICQSLASKFRQAINARSIGAIYKSTYNSLWAAAEGGSIVRDYLANAIEEVRSNRVLCAPYPHPADLVRLQLDEVWPRGAFLMRFNAQPMAFGLARLWGVGSEALPHQDIISRELPSGANGTGTPQLGQLGVNIYLACAETGGEIALWDRAITDEEYAAYRVRGVKGSYGFPRSELGNPAVIIAPELGDLIIINTSKVHAVERIECGDRITVSGFVGYWGDDEPLSCWS